MIRAGNYWPTCEFEAHEGRASWAPARYCRQALCLVDEVSRLIGLGWAADHFIAHAGLSWKPQRKSRRRRFVDRLARRAGPQWVLAVESYCVHAGRRRIPELEPLRFTWASTVKYATLKDTTAFFVRQEGDGYQRISVSVERIRDDRWRLRAAITEHANKDRPTEETWWTPKRPRRTQVIQIESGDCPSEGSTLSDGAHLAHVVIERQHEGAGLVMDLDLQSRRRRIELFGRSPPEKWGFLQPSCPLLLGAVRPVIHPLFEWKPPVSKSERAVKARQVEQAAIRALYDASELRDDLLTVLTRMGARELAERWAHSKPAGIEYARAISSKDRMDRLEEQLEMLKDEWEHSIRVATQYTTDFNKLTAESSVRWEDGEPPLNVRGEWGVKLLTRADRELEPVRLAPIAFRHTW